MSTFKDKHNNNFHISITMGKVKKVKNDLGIDLLSVFSSKEQLEQINNPQTFVDLLFVLLEDQINKAYKDADDIELAFADALDLDILDQATTLFTDALIDFFPEAKKSKLLRLMEAAKEMSQKQEAEIDEKLEEAIQQMTSGTMSDDAKQ